MNSEVLFLPKNSTSPLQPLDAGIIACVKKRYRRNQIQRAMSFIEEAVHENSYTLDLYSAVESIYVIWKELGSQVVHNCWVQAELLG